MHPNHNNRLPRPQTDHPNRQIFNPQTLNPSPSTLIPESPETLISKISQAARTRADIVLGASLSSPAASPLHPSLSVLSRAGEGRQASESERARNLSLSETERRPHLGASGEMAGEKDGETAGESEQEAGQVTSLGTKAVSLGARGRQGGGETVLRGRGGSTDSRTTDLVGYKTREALQVPQTLHPKP